MLEIQAHAAINRIVRSSFLFCALVLSFAHCANLSLNGRSYKALGTGSNTSSWRVELLQIAETEDTDTLYRGDRYLFISLRVTNKSSRYRVFKISRRTYNDYYLQNMLERRDRDKLAAFANQRLGEDFQKNHSPDRKSGLSCSISMCF